MQNCILRLIFDTDLYDEMTDCLLTYSSRELEFMGFAINAHTQSLDEISEQVSGFKQRRVIELNTNTEEAPTIYQHVKKVLAEADFTAQLYPLLDFKE